MSILLCRVDERLIHGQVVVGWGRKLHPDHYLVVDDDLAGSGWEQDLYLLAVDDDTEVSFRTVEDARTEWDRWTGAGERVVLLTRDVDSMRRLAVGGLLEGREVNLGGLHAGPGRTAVRPWLHITEEDRSDLRSLVEEGARPVGRDLPDGSTVSLDELLRE